MDELRRRHGEAHGKRTKCIEHAARAHIAIGHGVGGTLSGRREEEYVGRGVRHTLQRQLQRNVGRGPRGSDGAKGWDAGWQTWVYRVYWRDRGLNGWHRWLDRWRCRLHRGCRRCRGRGPCGRAHRLGERHGDDDFFNRSDRQRRGSIRRRRHGCGRLGLGVRSSGRLDGGDLILVVSNDAREHDGRGDTTNQHNPGGGESQHATDSREDAASGRATRGTGRDGGADSGAPASASTGTNSDSRARAGS